MPIRTRPRALSGSRREEQNMNCAVQCAPLKTGTKGRTNHADPHARRGDLPLAWISQTRTYQGGEPGRHLHFSGLMTPLICQIGPKTSANSGCSCSVREKRCISGRNLASGIVGIRS